MPILRSRLKNVLGDLGIDQIDDIDCLTDAEVDIRCYACRAACPACYCRTCFMDKAAPRWASKASTADESWMFHAGRAFHLAGRCVECGECERVCPMGIPISALNRMLDQEVRERFGYTAGLDPGSVPPLGTFRPEDSDPGSEER